MKEITKGTPYDKYLGKNQTNRMIRRQKHVHLWSIVLVVGLLNRIRFPTSTLAYRLQRFPCFLWGGVCGSVAPFGSHWSQISHFWAPLIGSKNELNLSIWLVNEDRKSRRDVVFAAAHRLLSFVVGLLGDVSSSKLTAEEIFEVNKI